MSENVMNDKTRFERRTWLKGAAGLFAGLGLYGTRAAAACGTTPRQTEGPFYPLDTDVERDWDLTRLSGHSTEALGERIYVTGIVTSQDCAPVEGVLVEIWQAAASGRYSHPGDTSGLPLDPHFQGYGRAITDSEGRYFFKTIIPGDYPASPTWQRPPHIHFKVQKRGFFSLTTQMYFKGHPLNATDGILQDVPADQRDAVVIEAKAPAPDAPDQTPTCRFDLTLRKVF